MMDATTTTTHEESGGDIGKEKEPTQPKQQQPQALHSGSGCTPIHLRMSIHGVRIHDDFDYDPSGVLNPVQMAECIGRDLKLTPEMVVAISIDIAEQVTWATSAQQQRKPIILVEETDPKTGRPVIAEIDEGGGVEEDRRNLTAAWEIPPRTHVTNVAHLVAFHRPPGGGGDVMREE